MQIGSINNAVNIRNNEQKYIKANNVFDNLEKIDIIDMIISKEDLFKNKEDKEDILNYINLLFFNKIKENIKYVECMKIIEDTKDRLSKNNNYDMTIDRFIMAVWEEING